MPRLVLSLLASLLVLPAVLCAQAPEQRYMEWTRLDFRPAEYQYRRNRILSLLRESGGGVLLVPSADGRTRGETFRQLDDFWYLTGLELPGSMLVLDGDRGLSTLFLPERDPRFENAGRPNDFPGRPLAEDAQLRSYAGTDRIASIEELESWLAERAGGGATLRLNGGAPGPLQEPELPLVGALGPTEALHLRLASDHPDARIANAYEEIARVRMIKSEAEIRALLRAAEATAEAIRITAATVAPGRDERTLQGTFEAACRGLGAQRIPFTPIVKSGANSLWPWRILAAHYDRRNRTLQDEELIILDVGCEVGGYVSDVGRTLPANGRFTDLQREKLMVSLRAADAIIEAIRPGVTFGELMRVAYDAIPDEEEPFMQAPSFFGHHIGLSVSDPALPEEPLAAGMVFTVEPWYYNHELEVAVFVEDVVVVTEDGVRVLTGGLARTPDELEALVR